MRNVLLVVLGFAACGGPSSEDLGEDMAPRVEELRGRIPRVGINVDEWLEYSATSDPVLVIDETASREAANDAYAKVVDTVKEGGLPYSELLSVPANQAGGVAAYLEGSGIFCPVNEDAKVWRGTDGNWYVTARATVYVRKPEFIPPARRPN